MTLEKLGKYRAKALMRVFGAVYLFTIGYVISIIVMTFGIIYGAVDLVWQLLANSDGLSESGTGAMWLERGFRYGAHMTMYVALGKDDFQWLP
jgi:hypothetical protein